jgi:flavin-binding protein dodecin
MGHELLEAAGPHAAHADQRQLDLSARSDGLREERAMNHGREAGGGPEEDAAGYWMDRVWIHNAAIVVFTTSHFPREASVSVAKISEITATSKKSFDDAVSTGISRANKTLRGITGAWVADQEVAVKNGKIIEYKVRLKLTFVLDA